MGYALILFLVVTSVSFAQTITWGAQQTESPTGQHSAHPNRVCYFYLGSNGTDPVARVRQCPTEGSLQWEAIVLIPTKGGKDIHNEWISQGGFDKVTDAEARCQWVFSNIKH